jgi:hypothetical protein
MKTLIIPDPHTKYTRAQAMLNAEPWDEAVLLGDYFDDWDDTVEDNVACAEWLVRLIQEHKVTALLGNHDQSYWFRGQHRCSGYTRDKAEGIEKVMGPHWTRLYLAYETQGWLLSHAGWDRRHGPYDPVQLEGALAMANHTYVPPILGMSWLRGGRQEVGGVTWQDWTELKNPRGMRQCVGHTQGQQVRWKGERAVCIDTRLRHYAIITDGRLEVKEFKY